MAKKLVLATEHWSASHVYLYGL